MQTIEMYFKFSLLLLIYNTINIVFTLNTNCGQYCHCGQPARPADAVVFLINKKIIYNKSEIYYENESKIKYKCLDPNNLLIGGDIRTCLSGQWFGNIPKCAVNIRNYVKLSSIDVFRSDSQVFNPEFSSAQEFHRTGLYSVPYYLKPRHCIEWSVTSGDELWLFKLNQLVDINYIQLVLHSKQNLQNILLSSRGQALKVIVNTSLGTTCQLISNRFQRNYLTLDYNCGSDLSVNQRLQSITVEYKSRQFLDEFEIALCDLRVYQMPVECGSPDYTLSTIARNQTQDIFTFDCKLNNYLIEGNLHIKCNQSTGRWTGLTPVCIPRPYCKLIDNNFDKNLIINYEEINVKENGDLVVFEGKFAYFQCNTSQTNPYNKLNGVTQVICRRGQWFGMSLLPNCVQSVDQIIKVEPGSLTDRVTIILMGSIIGILIIPLIVLLRRTRSKNSVDYKIDIYDDSEHFESIIEDHYYSQIDYLNLKTKLKAEDKINSMKSESNSQRNNNNIYVESVV